MIKKMWFALLVACLLGSYAYAETANTLELPASLKIIKEEAYYQAESIGEVVIPEGITEIGPRAFAYSGLTKINLPATLVDIAPDAFEGCGYFTAQVISGTAAYDFCVDHGIPVEVTGVSTPVSDFEYSVSEYTTGYGAIIQKAYIYAYNGTDPVVRIPSYIEGMPVTSFSSDTFKGNTDIQTVIIPESVTDIYSSAFAGCTNLTSVYFPAKLENIGNSAFEGCTALRLVDFPEASFIYNEDDCFYGHLFIGSAAFKDCDYLENISIRRTMDYGNRNSYTVASIQLRSSCFEGCDRLRSVELIYEGNKSTHINLGDSVFKNCRKLQSVSLSNDVSVGVSTFENCVSLEAFPVHLDEVSAFAFKGCTSLKSISAGYSNVSKIGESAFEGCTGLTNVHMLNIDRIAFGNTDTYGFIGKNAFANCINLIELNMGYDINEIGEGAFRGCVGIEHIILPGACATVGEDAFAGCNLSATVYVGSPAEAYMQANNIPCDVVNDLFTVSIMEGFTCSVTSYRGDSMDIVIPERFGPYTVTKLGANLLYYNNEFRGEYNTVTLPDTITKIGSEALGYSSRDLKLVYHAGSSTYYTVRNYFNNESRYPIFRSPSHPSLVVYRTIADGIEYLNIYDYEGDDTTVTIPNEIDGMKVERICAYSQFGSSAHAHAWTSVISDLFIEPGVSVYDYSFQECQTLTSVTWLGDIENIGRSAFSGCTALQSLTFNGNVGSIGSSAFSGCTSLQSLTFNGNVDSIGSSAFSGCTSLQSLTFNGNVGSIGEYAFYSYNEGERLINLHTVEFGGNVGSIGDMAFYGCEGLKNLSFLGSVESIGVNAFSKCTGLQTLMFNGDVGSIGEYAFSDCSSLDNPILPSGNPTIGENAFAYGNLRAITIPDGWTELPSYVFYQTTLPDKVMIPNSVTAIADGAFGYIYSRNDTPVIYCNEYSYAQTWANSMDLPVVLMNGNTFADYGCVIVPESLRLAAGTDTTVTAQVFPYDAALTPEWSSSAPEIASVDQNGKITAHAQGEAVITVSAGGASSEIAVSVYLPITDFTLSDAEITLDAGATAQLSVMAFTPAESSASFVWTTDNELMATVDENGLVSALSIGDAVITCTAENGLARSCTVHIVAPD